MAMNKANVNAKDKTACRQESLGGDGKGKGLPKGENSAMEPAGLSNAELSKKKMGK
jgi:hypothetical protein